jgi:hypothetical protein
MIHTPYPVVLHTRTFSLLLRIVLERLSLLLRMASTTEPRRSTRPDESNQTAETSDSEDEDVFHDARFPAEEEAVRQTTFPNLVPVPQSCDYLKKKK